MFDNKSSIKNRKSVFSFVRDSNSYLKVLTFQPSSVRVRYAAATEIASTRGEITSLNQNFWIQRLWILNDENISWL